MRARLYLPGSRDARALDQFLENNSRGDVRLDCDRIVVAANSANTPIGALVWRPAGFIHEFYLGSGLASRQIATALSNYAVADCLAINHRISQSVFLVDDSNDAMLRYVREELHATEHQGRVFSLDLK